MNYYSVATANETLPCSDEDYTKFLELFKEDDSGLEHQRTESGEIYLYTQENLFEDGISESFAKHVGEILKKAGMKHLEFGVACYGHRPVVGSSGGYFFRIQDDGDIVHGKHYFEEDGK